MVICQTVKTFISEVHPTSSNARNYKEHARVTGFVNFVASVFFLFALLTAATFKEIGAISPMISASAPSYEDFIHPTTFLMALILNEVPSSYCYFYATKKVKGENFLQLLL